MAKRMWTDVNMELRKAGAEEEGGGCVEVDKAG
jgi:hypothetical protein